MVATRGGARTGADDISQSTLRRAGSRAAKAKATAVPPRRTTRKPTTDPDPIVSEDELQADDENICAPRMPNARLERIQPATADEKPPKPARTTKARIKLPTTAAEQPAKAGPKPMRATVTRSIDEKIGGKDNTGLAKSTLSRATRATSSKETLRPLSPKKITQVTKTAQGKGKTSKSALATGRVVRTQQSAASRASSKKRTLSDENAVLPEGKPVLRCEIVKQKDIPGSKVNITCHGAGNHGTELTSVVTPVKRKFVHEEELETHQQDAQPTETYDACENNPDASDDELSGPKTPFTQRSSHRRTMSASTRNTRNCVGDRLTTPIRAITQHTKTPTHPNTQYLPRRMFNSVPILEPLTVDRAHSRPLVFRQLEPLPSMLKTQSRPQCAEVKSPNTINTVRPEEPSDEQSITPTLNLFPNHGQTDMDKPDLCTIGDVEPDYASVGSSAEAGSFAAPSASIDFGNHGPVDILREPEHQTDSSTIVLSLNRNTPHTGGKTLDSDVEANECLPVTANTASERRSESPTTPLEHMRTPTEHEKDVVVRADLNTPNFSSPEHLKTLGPTQLGSIDQSAMNVLVSTDRDEDEDFECTVPRFDAEVRSSPELSSSSAPIRSGPSLASPSLAHDILCGEVFPQSPSDIDTDKCPDKCTSHCITLSAADESTQVSTAQSAQANVCMLDPSTPIVTERNHTLSQACRDTQSAWVFRVKELPAMPDLSLSVNNGKQRLLHSISPSRATNVTESERKTFRLLATGSQLESARRKRSTSVSPTDMSSTVASPSTSVDCAPTRSNDSQVRTTPLVQDHIGDLTGPEHYDNARVETRNSSSPRTLGVVDACAHAREDSGAAGPTVDTPVPTHGELLPEPISQEFCLERQGAFSFRVPTKSAEDITRTPMPTTTKRVITDRTQTPDTALREPAGTSFTPGFMTPHPAAPLTGVLAMVEVFTSDGSCATPVFVSLLRRLGAKTTKTLNERVTHLVFKEGPPSIMQRVRIHNKQVLETNVGHQIYCVNSRWVSDSDAAGKRAIESDEAYMVNVEDGIRPAKRRRKSMEPSSLVNMAGNVVRKSSLGRASIGRSSLKSSSPSVEAQRTPKPRCSGDRVSEASPATPRYLTAPDSLIQQTVPSHRFKEMELGGSDQAKNRRLTLWDG